MAIALVTQTKVAGPANGGTYTPQVDTTGANLIIYGYAHLVGTTLTLSDSVSNTYTKLTDYGSGNPGAQMAYCANAAVSSTHQFMTAATASFPWLGVLAFSGSNTSSPFDAQNGYNGASGDESHQTGAVTPAEDGEVLATVIGLGTFSNLAINLGFTITASDTLAGGVSWGGGIAYLILGGGTAGSPVNPTWSWTSTSGGAGAISAYKAGAVAAFLEQTSISCFVLP